MKRTIVLTAVSWEDRFLMGLRRIVRDESPERVVLFQYNARSEQTIGNRGRAEDLCRTAGCDVELVTISYSNPARSWSAVQGTIEQIDIEGCDVLLDFSTMPRQTLWSLLLLLEEKEASGRYMYSPPESYGKWLSRDPGEPQLALKLGGEMEFGRGTVLVMVTGFDLARAWQMVRTFDPAFVHVMIQKGSQFDNMRRNRDLHRTLRMGEGTGRRVGETEVDAYADDHGFGAIMSVVAKHVDIRNVVMASLGPKPSALALYRVQRRFPSTGLVYSPAMEYNAEYSKGIGESILSDFPWMR